MRWEEHLPGTCAFICLAVRSSSLTNVFFAVPAGFQQHVRTVGTTPSRSVSIPRCSSLDDSKKRARSPYDNIPDLHQQYLRELQRVAREVGPEHFPKSLEVEAATPIVRDGRWRRKGRSTELPSSAADGDSKQKFEAMRAHSLAQYNRLRRRLLGDTAFVGALAFCAGWAFGDAKTAWSVALGAGGSLCYVVLLARGVDGVSAGGGGGVDWLAPARLVVLALLVIGAARRRDLFDVIPVLLGFLSYKVATILPLVTGEAFEDELA